MCNVASEQRLQRLKKERSVIISCLHIPLTCMSVLSLISSISFSCCSSTGPWVLALEAGGGGEDEGRKFLGFFSSPFLGYMYKVVTAKEQRKCLVAGSQEAEPSCRDRPAK